MSTLKASQSSLVRSEKGSLALEQVLFIGAIVAMSAGLIAFYDDLGTYFQQFSVANPPTNIGNSTPTAP